MLKSPIRTSRVRPSSALATAAALAALLVAVPAGAQWRNLPNTVPNGPDGKPNLSAPDAAHGIGQARSQRHLHAELPLLPEPGGRHRARERADDLGRAEDSRRARHRPSGLRGARRALPAAGRAQDQPGAGAVQDRADRQPGGARLRSVQPVAPGAPRRAGVRRRPQSRAGWASRRAAGRATRSWSRRAASTASRGSITTACPPATSSW